MTVSPTYRLALAVCLVAGTLWAAGTIGFEYAFATGASLAALSWVTLAALGVLSLLAWSFAAQGAAGALPDTGRLARPSHLAALLLLGALAPIILFRPDADDSYYMANIVFALAHPELPITDEVRGLFAGPLEPFRSAHWATATAYDYLSASIPWLTGAAALDIRYFLLPALAGAVLVAGCFLLLRELTASEREALIATFAVTVLYLVWVETHRDPGNFAFLRMFQGKAVIMTAALPAIAALICRFLRAPSLPTGLALALLVTGAAGMGASAVFLVGAAAAGIVVGAIAATPRQAVPVVIRAVIAGLLSAALLAPMVRGMADTLPLGLGSPANFGFPTTFVGHMQFLGKSTWLLLVLGCAIIVLATSGEVRRFVLGWTACVIILFANPVSGQLLIDHALGPNAYWRIFYALPWVPLAGLSAIAVYRLLPAWVGRMTVPAIALVAGLAVAAHMMLAQSRFGPGAAWPPGWKLPPPIPTGRGRGSRRTRRADARPAADLHHASAAERHPAATAHPHRGATGMDSRSGRTRTR